MDAALKRSIVATFAAAAAASVEAMSSEERGRFKTTRGQARQVQSRS